VEKQEHPHPFVTLATLQALDEALQEVIRRMWETHAPAPVERWSQLPHDYELASTCVNALEQMLGDLRLDLEDYQRAQGFIRLGDPAAVDDIVRGLDERVTARQRAIIIERFF